MFWYYVVALVVIGVDQLTKWIVVQQMALFEQITVIDHFFFITSHRNSGAAWGILQGQMWLFYIITSVVVIGLIYYMQKYKGQSKLFSLGLSLVLAGAIGNFIDRLFRQEVVDFLDFLLFSYDYPIFNVADSSLVVGVIIILIATFRDEKQKGSTAND